MIKYFCDRCGRQISKDRDREILMLHGELLRPRRKEARPWLHSVLCNVCKIALEDWLKQEVEECQKT